jgi:transcriptional regulator with XRE-family HTH domain
MKLKYYLDKQNISQTELAKRLNISVARVNNWTRGKNYPSAKYIPIISAILNIPIDLLFYSEV